MANTLTGSGFFGTAMGVQKVVASFVITDALSADFFLIGLADEDVLRGWLLDIRNLFGWSWGS